MNLREHTKNIFLEVLKEESDRNHTEFLYEYVKTWMEQERSYREYDENKVDIELGIQMTDFGDEIFNTIYGVERRLYGEFKPREEECGDEDATIMNLDSFSTSKGKDKSRKILRIHWIFHFDQIQYLEVLKRDLEHGNANGR